MAVSSFYLGIWTITSSEHSAVKAESTAMWRVSRILRFAPYFRSVLFYSHDTVYSMQGCSWTWNNSYKEWRPSRVFRLEYSIELLYRANLPSKLWHSFFTVTLIYNCDVLHDRNTQHSFTYWNIRHHAFLRILSRHVGSYGCCKACVYGSTSWLHLHRRCNSNQTEDVMQYHHLEWRCCSGWTDSGSDWPQRQYQRLNAIFLLLCRLPKV